MFRFSILLFALPASAQTTWHVDAAGTPPGTGTPADPYTSIQYAVDQPATGDGDTLLVAAGTYVEAIDTGVKSLTIRSSDGALATRLELPGGQTGFVVTLGFSGYVVLEGFTVAGRPEGGTSGVVLDEGAVRRCIVSGHRNGGAGVGGGSGVVSIGVSGNNSLERCTLIDNVLGASDAVFSTLSVSDSVFDGNDLDLWQNGNGLFASWSAWETQDGFVGGGNNLVGDPGLWNEFEGDPFLAPGSPCIDSANPMLPLDPDLSPADRGAVPFDAAYLPAVTVYCTSKVNSSGCAAAISVAGGPAASQGSPATFLIEATDVVEDVPGLLFYGTTGRWVIPFFGGHHCVAPLTTRTSVQLSGALGAGACKGTYSLDFNAWLKTPLGSLIAPGQTVVAQYWYRDPADATFGAATSDAVEFGVVP